MKLVDSVLLIQGIDDVKQLNDSILVNTKVICFDFVSHRLLRGKNIPHQIIDDYFNAKDKTEIDEKSTEITHNWYKQSSSKENLEFNLVVPLFKVPLDIEIDKFKFLLL